MIIIGIEDCNTCKIVKTTLPHVRYVELKINTKIKSNEEILKIKKLLGKLNPSGNFPVLIDDNYTKLIDTEVLLDNLSYDTLKQFLEK